jgi:hypothetical protein
MHMGRKGVVCLAAAMIVALGSSAPATHAVGRYPFQVLLNSDGSGRIFMNSGATPSWKACKPDLSECAPFASGGEFNTGGATPNTVFWGGENILTPVWKGRLQSVSPPSVQGAIRGNEVVTPIAGSWLGGWEDDYDELTVSVCKTADGTGCFTIEYEGHEEECGARGAVMIDPAFAGRYLRVIDHRYGSGTIFAGVGHPTYYRSEKVPDAATVSVAVLGKIAKASGPPSVDCGPPPLIDASISDNGTADVTCGIVGCHFVVIARSGKQVIRLARKIRPVQAMRGRGTAMLSLPSSAIKRLEGRRVQITVKINGKKAAGRTLSTSKLVAAKPKKGAKARASAAAPYIDVGLSPDGSGSLTANPPGAWDWRTCAPDLTGCAAAGEGPQISTGGAKEGTVFTATLAGRTLISPVWNGNVYFAKAPGLVGTVRANELVAPESGDWRGGWKQSGLIGTTQLAACRNADGSDCITLSNSHFSCVAQGSQRQSGAILDPVLTGWYLRVAQKVEFVGSSPVELHPENEAPFPSSGITSVVMAGQVAEATGPRTGDCGIPPQLQASISKAGVVRVRCGLGCHAVLLAKSHGHKVKLEREIAPMPFRQPTAELPKLRLPRSALARLGSGKAQLTVTLNAQRAARRLVKLAG